MSINCRINNGTVEAQNGMASVLYKSLEKKFGSNQAMDYYALTESDYYLEDTTGERDINGEMSFSDFMTFVTKRESEKDFSQETLDLQLITDDFSNIDKLYDSGIFNPSERNLKASGLFTADEIENIIYSKERQENLRIFLDNLNLDENITPITEYKVKSNETNSIGIRPLLNPEDVRKESQSDLQEIQIIRPENQTFETIMNTLDVAQLSEVENAAYRISRFANRELIIEEFDNLQDSFIDAGLDIPISDIELNNKSTEWLQNFANETLKFSQDISEESAKEFATFLDSVIQRPEISVESLETTKPATFRKYESLENEVTDFNEKSFIKHSEGLYQSVKTDYSLNELYEGLYNKVKNDNTLIPINLSQAEISDEINKEEVLEDIKSYILSNIDTLPQTDTETAEKIIAIKILTKAPIKNTENYKVPTGNVAEDFVSEFNKERLDHKRRNTPTYNRFYKFLKVDHMGIRPIDQGDFTKLHITKNVPSNMKERLTNYFSQNKNTTFDMSEETPPIENIERVVALNNPFSIDKITSDYSIESENEIVTMEDSEFVRVRDEVYEKVMSNGENNLYKKVTDIIRPITNKKPSFLNTFNKTQENTIEYKKYLTKQDLEEINNKHFNCA